MIRKKYFSMLAGASFSSIINALLIITDSLVCGQLLGDTAVSAVSLVAPVYNLSIFIAMLLSLGIPILYSRAVGSFQKEEADRVLGTGLFTALVGGALIFHLMTFCRDSYLAQFQLPEELSSMAKDYFNWVRFELLLMPVAEVMVETIFADGDESCMLIVSVVETAANVILSLILCRTMGIAGVGLASFIAVVLRLLVSLTHLLKKTNTLRLNLYFSFSVFRKSLRLALIDAGNYLSLAFFAFALNAFVAWRFGPDKLILAAVILTVQEFQLIFDGIGEVISPILSVYLSENCFKGVRKICRLAFRTAAAEGGAATVLLIALSGALPGLLGITDPAVCSAASNGIILMSLGMIFVSWLYLLTSYYRLLDRIRLSFGIAVLRDAGCVLAFIFLFGTLFGIGGVFAGTAAGPAAAFLLTLGYIYLRYGRENLPLLIADREKSLQSDIFELEVRPEAVIETRDSVEHLLRGSGVEEKDVLRCMLVLEEVLMLICEKNPGGKVRGECAVTVSPEKITLVIRDDGRECDLTDSDLGITSFRCYAAPGILRRWAPEGKHLMALSFNRNCFEMVRTASGGNEK